MVSCSHWGCFATDSVWTEDDTYLARFEDGEWWFSPISFQQRQENT